MSALKITALRIALSGECRRMILSAASGPLSLTRQIKRAEHRREDGKIFRDIIGDAEGRERAAGHEELFPDLDDLDEFGWVAIEIDHVARFARRLCTGVHRHAHVRLGQRGRIVRPVAGHRDQVGPSPVPSRIRRSLSSGVACAMKSSTPDSAAIAPP